MKKKKRKKKKEKVKEKYILYLYCICVCSSSSVTWYSRLGHNRLLSVTLSKKCYSNSIVLGMYLMQLRGSLNMHAACMLFHIITSYPGTL